MAEHVLVWNGKEDIDQLENNTYGVKLVSLHDDPAKKFQFFISFEHSLGNHLMNRYHPLFNLNMEALSLLWWRWFLLRSLSCALLRNNILSQTVYNRIKITTYLAFIPRKNVLLSKLMLIH